ncbi:MAG: hypothetical protein WCA98_06010 [Candidatus Acidiferrales bacterium]
MLTTNSDPDIQLAIGFVTGVVFFFLGFREYRKYRVIADTPRIPIVSAAIGLVNVRGTAESTGAILSPVSRTPCCFFRVDIQQWTDDGQNGSWHSLRVDADGPLFHISDDSGKILVDLHGAVCDLAETAERVVDSDDATSSYGIGGVDAPPAPYVPPTDDELLQYVQFTGWVHTTRWPQTQLDTPAAANDPAVDHTEQEFLELLRGLTPPATTPPGVPPAAAAQSAPTHDHFVSAGTGRYKLTEKVVLPGTEYEIIGTCVENPNPVDELDHNMLVNGWNESLFEISCEPEAQLVGNTLWKAKLKVFGGALLAVGCFYFFLQINHLL